MGFAERPGELAEELVDNPARTRRARTHLGCQPEWGSGS